MVVTDAELNTIAEAPVYVLHQPDEVLDGMDSWNKSTHGKSGLDRQGARLDAHRGRGRARASSSS